MNWIKQGLFYRLDNNDDWRVSHTQLPIVDTQAGHNWRIYYSSRDAKGQSLPVYLDVETGHPENIIYQHNQPLLPLGAKGSFDEHGIMPTAVVHKDDEIYLYYIGWAKKESVPYQNAIGLAVSVDGGQSFEKYVDEPLIAKNEIDPIFTGTFNVFKTDNLWHGYYMSCTEWKAQGDELDPCYLLKYASSKNGIDWQRDGHIAIDFKQPDEGGIVAASVIQLAEQFYMWFCYRKQHDFRINKKNSYRIGFAHSKDARQWVRGDEQAGITVAADGWDSEMICYPNVVQHKNRLFMFYNGNGFGQSGMGYATCSISSISSTCASPVEGA
jgi:sucrose-6-phosphate hydrolase SacC (GH32 family)